MRWHGEYELGSRVERRVGLLMEENAMLYMEISKLKEKVAKEKSKYKSLWRKRVVSSCRSMMN